jgi:YVTN family beta-propeller protein
MQTPFAKRAFSRTPGACLVLFVTWLLAAFPGIGFAQVWTRPTHSSPIALSINNGLLWSVNPDDDSVSVFRTDSNVRLAKITVGKEPQSIALNPENTLAFVANAAGNSVTVIRINDPLWGTFSAVVDAAWGQNGHITTGAEPYNIVISPDGRRVFVANSSQDTITVINTATRALIGHVDLRNSLANDPDRSRHFQPRGLAVTADNTKLYVTRFLSFTRPGGKQADDFGREGLVAVLNINTASTSISDYAVARVIPLAPQITGFRFPGLTNDTAAFPNQLQSIVLRGDQAYLPNIAASPTGPLRFNLDTHAFVSVIDGVNGTSPADSGTNKFLNLHLGARTPEAGKIRLFFANPWAIGFTTQSGAGNAYVVSAASDLLVKLNVDANGKLSFTASNTTTRYIDLNNPDQPATAGANAGKNPIGIAIRSDGTRAYVANFVSRNISVVDLATDVVIATTASSALPTPGSTNETVQVGAEMFFSSRGHFDSIPGTNSLRDRLSSEGWQSCASCHFNGLTDGVVWQFAAGPRKSVPLNSTWNPHNRDQQRVLNYSAIFDEVEDFEANIRNVSGPGNLATPINGNALNPNQGLLIGDNGDLNVAPGVVNAFARANANRPQVTVTLPGSTNQIPALTALREWVRFAVRTPNAPLPGSWGGGGPSAADIAEGRKHFLNAGCSQCHQGGNWTISLKDFTSPPAGAEIFTERNPTNFTGNPVGAQYLNRFLRDVGSFNLGVAGAGNDLGNNVGGIEVAAPAVAAGVQQPAQDGLGRDYNADGKGIGFNVPSLQGIYNVPPFMHNGAAESIAAVVADVKHRTDNGRLPDVLSDPAKQAQLVRFVESIAFDTVPFVRLETVERNGQIVVSFESVPGVRYALQGKDTLATAWSANLATVTATGVRTEVTLPNNASTKFLRLVHAP